ncbi:MAG: hypothetical protein LBQ02_02885 [Candidatus Nomurabacteria bacterium]|jgi:t-SNARE complex subunit (syntaxin)|nr:hypothetical protein [Candidatus Nomurabacteria bacterium]
MSDELDNFIDDILKQKGMDKAVDDVYDELHADLKSRLLDQIDRAVVSAMPEDKIDELNDLLDKNPDATDQDIQNIVASSGVDAAQVTAQTLLRFRDLYLGNAVVTEA